MTSILKKILISLAVLCLVVIVGIWLLLSSSLLSGPRGDLTARLLSGELGLPVEINGGVNVNLGSVLRVSVEDLAVPAASGDARNIASVGQLGFNVRTMDLLRGRITLSELSADEATILLQVDDSGLTSWSTSTAKSRSDAKATTGDGEGVSVDAFGLLSGEGIQFTNTGITYEDARNGLDLTLAMADLSVAQADKSSPLMVTGFGSLNGQDLTIEGAFPRDQPFEASVTFSQMQLVLNGTPSEEGFSTTVSGNIDELGQLLDVLKLQKAVSGSGKVSAVIELGQSPAKISDLNVAVELDTGQSLSVTGDIGELGNSADVSLDTKIRLYRNDDLPPPATLRRDLKLVGVDMTLEAQPNGIPKRGMVIATNGFILDTTGEGPPPIEVSGISRTDDGLLQLDKAILRIGPPDAPFLVVEGSIADALRLEGIDFGAELSVPATNIVAPERFQGSDLLGHLTGGFRLKGNAKVLALSDLNAQSIGTDLWHLNVTGSVKNALKFSDVDLNVQADVPSGAKLLDALQLQPIETGEVKLSTDLKSDGTKWSSKIFVDVDASELDIEASMDLADPHPIVRGTVESDLIRINHLRDIVASAIELGRLNTGAAEKGTDEQTADTDAPVQPLVLDQADAPIDGEEDIQPLVLENDNATALEAGSVKATDPPGPLRDVTLQPLGRAVLLSGMDLSVKVDLRKVEGDKGTTNLTGDLEFQDGQAQLGPIKFEYGGGYFDIAGSMDLDEAPDVIKLKGSTGGWDFGAIMQAIRFKKGAGGILNGEFEVEGHHTSVNDFLSTMKGSAYVSMRNGSIETQLLDIAGLGVLPWLFSSGKEPVAPIVCARAPLYISDGRISTDQIVVETDQVQIVVLGGVNLKSKTLDITGQPRKIGKPLSRSPWPFTITGSMADPKIKVKDGPRKVKRSDGASQMPENRKLCVADILQLQ